MQSIEVISTYGRDSIKAMIKAGTELKRELAHTLWEKYTDLFVFLITRELPLSRMEVEDFDREFARLFDTYQLYLRRSVPQFYDGHTRATPLYLRATAVVSSLKPYTEKTKEDLYGILKVSLD